MDNKTVAESACRSQLPTGPGILFSDAFLLFTYMHDAFDALLRCKHKQEKLRKQLWYSITLTLTLG